MLESKDNAIQTYIRQVPVTYERRPYNPSSEENGVLKNAGTAYASLAPTLDSPHGTQSSGWADKHSGQTVLQQHCAYFDPDGDSIIWPHDTYRGFRNLGFNVFMTLFSVFMIHFNFSYPTCPGYLPDPFFRVYLANIHKAKHGSDTGTYDNEGRFVPQKFEDMFAKYGDKDTLTKWDMWELMSGQRVLFDVFGTLGAMFEWLALYLLLWPNDGVIRKEDLRRVYDGSIFSELSLRRSGKAKAV
ncbi:Caleosin-domain-containing protein [Daedalea quercina L-15889]|uniref:Caleosin-domain-containing protein n=1 Tax=Daedalea quercina L-15889 TaxID=1314783 RepID=A0A165SJP7_9APHY|nr:Caleosin-domain-containing protein [Daedalea quercina L-15889]